MMKSLTFTISSVARFFASQIWYRKFVVIDNMNESPVTLLTLNSNHSKQEKFVDHGSDRECLAINIRIDIESSQIFLSVAQLSEF